MANLSITAACNRSCSYCFARGAFSGDGAATEHMSRAVFERALDFLERSGIDEARLLGGEPTLHPEFPALVERALERGLRVLVFSNGLMPEAALRCLEQAPDERVAVLLNANPPGSATLEEDRRQRATLARLGPKVTPGLNINAPGARFGFLLDLIGEFGLSRSVRLGLAHPRLEGGNAFLHPRYYAEVGRRVSEFADAARESGVQLDFDCGFVPCMFVDGGLEPLGAGARELGRRCNPILDILPDGQVVSCYPLAGLGREPLPDDRDATWLRCRFGDRLAPYRSIGLFRECRDCATRAAGDCVGGCLSASMQRLRHAAFEVALPSSRLAVRRRQDAPVAGSPRAIPWSVPYVDQPLRFWEELREEFGDSIGEVYLPLPGASVGSGRPRQPTEHVAEFLRQPPFPCSALLNAVVLPDSVDEAAPPVIEALRRMAGETRLVGATVANLQLAAQVRDALPDLRLTASVLMDVGSPQQALMLDGICDALVPASRVVRDLPALQGLRAAFRGRIRLIVNEACLPGCPFRTQHFHEMAAGGAYPRSLCNGLLEREPWMRLTGAWVLPQHLHLYDGLYDELKLAGRVTLRDPADYRRVLGAYVHRRSLSPEAIGGGPAAVTQPMEITEDFYAETLQCGRQCHTCTICRDYWREATGRD